jgi:hypothetical protein
MGQCMGHDAVRWDESLEWDDWRWGLLKRACCRCRCRRSLSLVPVVAAVILVVFRPDYTHADDGDSMA